MSGRTTTSEAPVSSIASTHAGADATARVALAVIGVGCWTVRQISARTGLGVATVHAALVELRRQGVVGFEDGRQATLHPEVRIVKVF